MNGKGIKSINVDVEMHEYLSNMVGFNQTFTDVARVIFDFYLKYKDFVDTQTGELEFEADKLLANVEIESRFRDMERRVNYLETEFNLLVKYLHEIDCNNREEKHYNFKTRGSKKNNVEETVQENANPVFFFNNLIKGTNDK